MGFYLYYPIVNRTELETGHRDKANHVKGKKKRENSHWSIFRIKRVESNLKVEY